MSDDSDVKKNFSPLKGRRFSDEEEQDEQSDSDDPENDTEEVSDE